MTLGELKAMIAERKTVEITEENTISVYPTGVCNNLNMSDINTLLVKQAAKQAAREANLEAAKNLDALALITGAKWDVEQGVHTLTGETVWTVKPVERFDKAQFYAVSKRLSDDLDGGYFRGGWTVRIDPAEYLATGKLDAVTAKRIADIKAARKAAREAKKAAKKA